MAPMIGVSCFLNVCRVMKSEIVRMTSGCNWICGLVSVAGDDDINGFDVAAFAIFVFLALRAKLSQPCRISEHERSLLESTKFV